MKNLGKKSQYFVFFIVFIGCTSTQFSGNNASNTTKKNTANNLGQGQPVQPNNQTPTSNQTNSQDNTTDTTSTSGLISDGKDTSNGNLNGGGDKAPVDPNSIPGVLVSRFGIEFEDWIDFNYDIRFCFEGAFKVNGNSIVSYTEQTVIGHSDQISACACNHTLGVTITRADGTIDAKSYPSKATPSLQMTFKIGDRLDVTLTPISGDLCVDAGTVNQIIRLGSERARLTLETCD